MKANEIRGKSRQEIKDDIDARNREILNIKFQWQSGEIRNPAQRKGVRRDVARLKTVLREMDLGINKLGTTTE